MTTISTTVGKNHLEEMEWPSETTKEIEMQYLGATSKTTKWSIPFQGKPFIIMVIQVYAPKSNVEELKLNGSIKTYNTF